MIITIDGPVATGKSSVAKGLARALGYIYFDTGAMYRAVTWAILEHHIKIEDPTQLNEFLKQFSLEIKIRHGDKRYFVDNKDVTETIRSEEVTALVSKVSAIPEVREKLVKLQRDLARGVNAILRVEIWEQKFSLMLV